MEINLKQRTKTNQTSMETFWPDIHFNLQHEQQMFK